MTSDDTDVCIRLAYATAVIRAEVALVAARVLAGLVLAGRLAWRAGGKTLDHPSGTLRHDMTRHDRT